MPKHPPQTLQPELYTCFDKNMEERLFHNRQNAERHAMGDVTEYVKLGTVKELMQNMGSDLKTYNHAQTWQLLMPAEADQKMIEAASEALPTLTYGQIASLYQVMRMSWELRHPSAYPPVEAE